MASGFASLTCSPIVCSAAGEQQVYRCTDANLATLLLYTAALLAVQQKQNKLAGPVEGPAITRRLDSCTWYALRANMQCHCTSELDDRLPVHDTADTSQGVREAAKQQDAVTPTLTFRTPSLQPQQRTPTLAVPTLLQPPSARDLQGDSAAQTHSRVIKSPFAFSV